VTAPRPKKKPSVVTQVPGTNVQIFSSPKTQRALPVIEGPVTVSFKHENSIHGMAIGQIVVIAHDPYNAWLKIHGSPYTSKSGSTSYLVPFGAMPAGRHDIGWATKHVAHEIAAHCGVALKEF
jgi:hypothetical protein